MLMYHGTVDTFLPEIKAEGLRPHVENAYRLSWGDGSNLRDREKVEAVFLSHVRDHSIAFAMTRVRYLKTPAGGSFQMFENDTLVLRKEPGAQVIENAVPVVLTIEIDENDPRLELDPRDSDVGCRYVGSIPPSAIKRAEKLSPDRPERDDMTVLKEHMQASKQQFCRDTMGYRGMEALSDLLQLSYSIDPAGTRAMLSSAFAR